MIRGGIFYIGDSVSDGDFNDFVKLLEDLSDRWSCHPLIVRGDVWVTAMYSDYSIRCEYCGTLSVPGMVKCRSCGAPLEDYCEC